MPTGTSIPFTALLMAGSRPEGDPLAHAAGVPSKALVPIAGQPMINHSARALLATPGIGRLIIVAQQPQAIVADPATAWLASDPRVELRVSTGGISQSILDLADAPDTQPPLLVTTADNVLMSPDMLSHFLTHAKGADVAVGMVERRVLLARYPGSRRTWIKMRAGHWSGANLFWLGTPRARAVIAFWRSIEQDRKSGRKIVSAFGPLLTLAALFRLLSMPRGLELAGKRFGVQARMVPMPQAEACIDADKPEDIVLIERIMASK